MFYEILFYAALPLTKKRRMAENKFQTKRCGFSLTPLSFNNKQHVGMHVSIGTRQTYSNVDVD
jgi:hypothetical protein